MEHAKENPTKLYIDMIFVIELPSPQTPRSKHPCFPATNQHSQQPGSANDFQVPALDARIQLNQPHGGHLETFVQCKSAEGRQRRVGQGRQGPSWGSQLKVGSWKAER